METFKKFNSTLIIAIMSFAMLLSACKKEATVDPTPTPTPTPTNLQNYVGATADYGEPVSFTTGEVDGEIWLIAFSLSAKYVIPNPAQTYSQTYSNYNSSGIKQFTSNNISIDTGTGLTFTATIKEDGKYLDGNYIYNYINISIHSADFATDRE